MTSSSDDVTSGVGLVSGQRPGWHDRNPSEVLQDIVASCQAVEAAGIDAAWFSEHHFFDDSYLSSVFPLLGAVAARTSTLRLGTGVLLAHFYNTLRLAEDAASRPPG